MNSLNILSARVSPPQTPAPSRSNSYGNVLSSAAMGGQSSRRNSREDTFEEDIEEKSGSQDLRDNEETINDEETPLLSKEGVEFQDPAGSGIPTIFIDSIRLVLSFIAKPAFFLVGWLYDENGNFSPISQIRSFGASLFGGGGRVSTAQTLGVNSIESDGDNIFGRRGSARRSGTSLSTLPSNMSSESESDDRSMSETDHSIKTASNRHARSKSSDEIAPARRSIRIKLHNEDNLRQRAHRKAKSTSSQSNGAGAISAGEISPATLKSPTSPASSLLLTKYPRAPAPPRPLIPRRQPSYTIPEAPSGRLTQKTLILDLDETLIHSMAKGGRMSTGHMVEVKLNTLIGAGGTTSIGPQHPILYYVHKRPHCDDFLRRVCLCSLSI